MAHSPTPPRTLRFAVLTVSDTRTVANDTSGALLAERVAAAGHTVAHKRIIADDKEHIRQVVQSYIDDPGIEVVLSTGGTGLTGRDVTTDAFESLYTKAIPGFGELFRMLSFRDIGTSTIQSRATGGVAGTTLLFALPGSTGACRTGWDEVLVHQFDASHKPCNFISIIPRLGET